MSDLLRTGSRSLFAIGLAILIVSVAPIAAVPAQQPSAEPEAAVPVAAEPEAEPAPAETEEAPSRAEKRQKAKEQRIAEYLRKKDEKRRQREGAQDALSPAAEPTSAPREQPVAATEATPEPSQAAPRPPPSSKRPSASKRGNSGLPRELARAQNSVRGSSLARNDSVRGYLDLIDRHEASAQQLAAFGNFLADNGLNDEALAYYRVALSLEKRDPVLWVNMGTLHRKHDDLGAATQAYVRALSISPNYAFAHYNLGAVLDAQGKYEDALAAYRMALSLDPSLGDPLTNPQAANNDLLLAVKLTLYREQSGSMGLGLVDLPQGGLTNATARPEGDLDR